MVSVHPIACAACLALALSAGRAFPMVPTAGAEVPQPPGPSARERAHVKATSALRRLMPPAPDRARMVRALAIAGIDLGASAPGLLDAAASRASGAFGTWRAEAEPALLGRLAAEFERAPLEALPEACVRPVTERRVEGLRWEAEAFDALLASAPPGPAGASSLASTVLAGLQWQAIALPAGQGGLPDLRTRDLLEIAACRTAALGAPPADLRAALSGYAAERARLLRRLAEAALESDARKAEAARAASAWSEARTARDADPRQDVRAAGDWRPVAFALQMAPALVASAELADLQRKAAAQLAASLDPGSAWCVYAALRGSGPACDAAELLADAERSAIAMPADLRPAALELIRAHCAADRQRIEREVDAMARASAAAADRVRSVARRGEAIERANLDELEAALRASASAPSGAPPSPVGRDPAGIERAMIALRARLEALGTIPPPQPSSVQ